MEFRTGDVLVFYSDGVIEMRNAEGDEFGLKRLAETVRQSPETARGNREIHQRDPRRFHRTSPAA